MNLSSNFSKLPRHGRSRQDNATNASNPWVQIHIRTNVFTGDEWPFQEPLSFNNFSIGEEQSMSTVIALAWSPRGLAKNKRCVLAVLTSNLVLSLWASNSDPSVVASWERVLVVNNGVWNSYIHKGMFNATLASTDPILRRSLRIRSTAWAPLLQRNREHDQTKITCLSAWYFLAVTTDNNSILFLLVSSPHIDHPINWDARIVRQHNFAIGQRQELLYRHGSLLSAALDTKSFIDRVSWSEWIQFENFAEISIHFQNDNANIAYAKFRVSFEFSPATTLSKFSTSPSTKSFIYYYDNLDISSQDLPRSTLHKQALQLRTKIDRQNDYGDLTMIKFWGLAAHMNYVAICVTFHPGDMVDYLLASEERATILFSLSGTNCLITEDENFPWESDSSTGKTAGTQIAILETILDLETQSRLTLGGLSDKMMYAAACASMLLWDTQRVQRLSRVKNVLERLEQRINVDLGSEVNVCSQFSVSPDLTMEDVAAILGEATGARSEDDVATAKNIFSVCSICASLINWQSLSEATCSRGHCFSASSHSEFLFYT